MVSVRVEKVSKHFGDVVALDDVSVEIAPGELFFLLGPSGCGKTTLLRIIAGFYESDAGHVFFDGQKMTDVPAHKRNTAMMFQSYALWPHMNVAENIGFGLKERKVSRAEIETKVKEALEVVHMGGLGERSVNALSGGQQQRVALARALVVRPRCLLLDEPLSNLDARLRLEMRTEIRRVCRSFGLTAIYVTHDQKEALSIADRMAVLDKGRVVQIGAPRHIYRRPVNRLVAEFIGETNTFGGTVSKLGGDELEVETPLGGLNAVMGADEKPAVGDTVSVSIRPETLVLGATSVGKSARNQFRGEVVGTTYFGGIAYHEVRVGNTEGLLKVAELNPALEPGDMGEVTLSVDRDDVVVLVR